MLWRWLFLTLDHQHTALVCGWIDTWVCILQFHSYVLPSYHWFASRNAFLFVSCCYQSTLSLVDLHFKRLLYCSHSRLVNYLATHSWSIVDACVVVPLLRGYTLELDSFPPIDTWRCYFTIVDSDVMNYNRSAQSFYVGQQQRIASAYWQIAQKERKAFL